MSYSDNITASLDHSRNCLRRIARHDDTEFSHQSILNAMDKFVKSVNTMDETILVPCRLMDLKVGDENDPCPKKLKKKNPVYELLNSVDLFEVYNLLKGAKADLLWGQENNIEEKTPKTTTRRTTTPTPTPTTTTTTAAATASDTTTTTPVTTTLSPSTSLLLSSTPTTTTTSSTPTIKGHVRRPSTVSVASTNSSTSNISDSESDAGVENDSGIEESQDFENRTEKVANDFRRHLQGLTKSLRQLNEAAEYLIFRYQHDIGAPV